MMGTNLRSESSRGNSFEDIASIQPDMIFLTEGMESGVAIDNACVFPCGVKHGAVRRLQDGYSSWAQHTPNFADCFVVVIDVLEDVVGNNHVETLVAERHACYINAANFG